MPRQRSGRRAGQRFDAEHRVVTEALLFLGELDPAAIGPNIGLATHYEATPPGDVVRLLAVAQLVPECTTFVDIGSGMGRVVLIASRLPFKQVVGVEISPALHEIARENLATYDRAVQRCRERPARARGRGRLRVPARRVGGLSLQPVSRACPRSGARPFARRASAPRDLALPHAGRARDDRGERRVRTDRGPRASVSSIAGREPRSRRAAIVRRFRLLPRRPDDFDREERDNVP